MALKENLASIKTEISSQEQFLEGIIRSERFFKKYLKFIVAAAVILIVGMIVYEIWDYKTQSALKKANNIYLSAINNGANADIAELKNTAPSLYALYLLKKSDDNQTTDKNAILNEILALENTDEIIKDIAKFRLDGKNDKILLSYNALMKGFLLLKDNKISAADVEFAKIPLNSPLQSVVKNLKHFRQEK